MKARLSSVARPLRAALLLSLVWGIAAAGVALA